MITSLTRRIIALLVAGLVAATSMAQERLRDDSVERTLRLLKAPSTPTEYWDAVKFSLNVGKYEDAATYLDRLLAGNPPAELLLAIRERDAATYFPKLSATPELQQRAIELLRVTERAAQQRARDPERIHTFINYLTRSAQHRAYGIAQLRTAGPDAVPYLLAALQDPGLAEHRSTILTAMQKLDSRAVPPLVAALSAPNQSLVADVIEVLSVLGDSNTATHLRYVAEAPEIPQAIQSRARTAIERILKVGYSELPSAVEMLTAQANRYYEHLVHLNPSSAGVVTLWRWVPPEGLKADEVSVSYAEEYFGLSHCRQALVLHPDYEPAQVALLSLALEKAAERAGVDQALPEGLGQASAGALAAGGELLVKVIARAIAERHPVVVLSALRALSQVGDANVLAPKNGVPSPVLQALALPDRRIQFAAAEVVLSLRPQQAVGGANQVIPILSAALLGDANPKAIVIDPNSERASTLASLVADAGYESQFVRNAREGFARAATATDVELIFMDANIYDPELSPALASFRNDPRTTAIPILVVGNDLARVGLDPLEESLRRGDPSHIVQVMQQLGESVAQSTLDSAAKDPIHEQIVESSRVLQRFAKQVHITPPSRVFMSLLINELDRITQRVKVSARSNVAEQTALTQECERLAKRVKSVAMRLAERNIVEIHTASYPGERELSKFERRYPRVKYLARPVSLEMLRLQLDSFLPGLQAKPLNAAERAEQARRAAVWLARIARGEIRGFDIRPAESAILSVLADDALGTDAIAAASCMPTTASQTALAQLVLNESASMPLRLDAARQIPQSLRRFGTLMPAQASAELRSLLDNTTVPALHQALAATLGAMKPGAMETGERLGRLPTPPFDRESAPAEPAERGEADTLP
jgi:CheY-like chemotaxis protein/tetratricopeptide (TPR) repeat protein